MLPSTVDSEIDTFSKWLKGLNDEDVKEFGSKIDRTDNDLRVLYSMYLKGQRCEEAKTIRTTVGW